MSSDGPLGANTTTAGIPGDVPNDTPSSELPDSSSGIPRGRFQRGSILGGAVARASAKKVQLAVSQPFRDQESKKLAAERTDTEIAELLFEALGTMKGTALKLAQVLAAEVELVPEAFRQELGRATHRAPSLNRALVRRILQAELGDCSRHFAHFELAPFAAASLGQVHAARAHDGTALAIKVQYPNLAEGIASDVAMLRAVLRPTRYARIFAAPLAEIEERLAEELDYEKEAAHTAWFATHLRDERLVLPEVRPSLSSKRVLATTRIIGVHVDEWLESNPSREQRDHYGQLLVDVFHDTALRLGVIHADPNPGNYLFRDDSRLGIIDFGCVKQLDEACRQSIVQLAHDRADDPEHVLRAHRAMGVQYRSDVPKDELLAFLQKWGSWISKPYRNETFDFEHERDYFADGAELARDLYRYLAHYDAPFVFFGRAHHGLLRLLQKLGARVRMRAAVSSG